MFELKYGCIGGLSERICIYVGTLGWFNIYRRAQTGFKLKDVLTIMIVSSDMYVTPDDSRCCVEMYTGIILVMTPVFVKHMVNINGLLMK